MARRKEVFQSKVFQKLYPAPLKVEEQPTPPHIVEALSKKIVKRKAPPEDKPAGDALKSQVVANQGRMYTVLPPPADYKPDPEVSVTPSQTEGMDRTESTGDPAEESNEEQHQDNEEGGQNRKRRRRRKKAAVDRDCGKNGAESGTSEIQKPVDEPGEQLSRNKKRKLKKKRHKEKLLSMGLMPRATALEFTYQKDEEEEEEEEETERMAAEVSDFLRKTMEMYTSDSSSGVNKRPLLSGTMDDLLSSVTSGCGPTPVLKQLHRLKAFVGRKETNKLERELEELRDTSPMSAEETAAVVSLFQYWITDILPVQGDKETELSATPP